MSTHQGAIDERAIDELVRGLAPIRDDELPPLTATPNAAELLEAIVAEPRIAERRTLRSRGSRIRMTRLRLAACAGVAALLAVATVGPVLDRGGTPAAAVVFHSSGDNIVADVTDPFADEQRLNEAFADRGLDIRLRLVPVSPQLVGQILASDPKDGRIVGTAGGPPGPDQPYISAELVNDGGSCTNGPPCPIGLAIPRDFDGSVTLTVGRSARSGERFDASSSALLPGEALHCSDILGQPVAEAARRLAGRAQTRDLRISWREAPRGMETLPRLEDGPKPSLYPPSPTQLDDMTRDTNELDPAFVPDRPVTGAVTVAPGEVIVWVGTGPVPGAAQRSDLLMRGC